MTSHRIALLLVAAVAAAEDIPEALQAAAGKLGVEFRAVSPGVFAAALASGLGTCDRIDLEARVGEGGAAEVVAYPRIRGQRLDPRRTADRDRLLAKLGEECKGIAPLKWAVDAELPVRAAWAGTLDGIEAALLAAPAIDKEVAALLPALEPALSDADVNAKLAEASGADEAKRNGILASVVAYLPELAPAEPGHATFVPVTMNRRGVAFDAFRFRVPGKEGERRLVWAFAVPTGTVKGWFIAPVAGDAQKFVRFHRGGSYEGMPDGHASVLQRSETPLRAGAEYILWFQFKVETPVDMCFALSCVPYDKSERDAQAAVEKALGLKPR
ncbi:MAG: hypothetical protein L6Q95_10720 [Planctomycetes bacterium]|nr:hypothetical protein [Planctomycetota bacterium]